MECWLGVTNDYGRFGWPSGLAALLSFNAGFVDIASFLGLQGLFTAHVTGNLVTLAATLVLGMHGIIAKLIALPEFVLIVALARLAGSALRARGLPALRFLLLGEVFLLVAFFVLGLVLGPFPNSDTPGALLAGFASVAGMAVQTAVQPVHFGGLPAMTAMTGNATQVVLDSVDLLCGGGGSEAPAIRLRFLRTLRSIFCFAGGSAIAAILYHWIGFWCLAVPVAAAIVASELSPPERVLVSRDYVGGNPLGNF
jgi:uncharacterized membrane protein YoaK (UPF0700 family)